VAKFSHFCRDLAKSYFELTAFARVALVSLYLKGSSVVKLFNEREKIHAVNLAS